MNKTNEQPQKGFTIIEVVLVLAIAALIFLMVFIALPTLQRNQRDTQRRSDMSRVLSQLSSFQANNKGKVPTAAQVNSFRDNYLDGPNFVDPAGNAYIFDAPAAPTGAEVGDEKTIFYYPGFVCDGEVAVAAGGNIRQAAFRLRLEDNGTVCMSNES